MPPLNDARIKFMNSENIKENLIKEYKSVIVLVAAALVMLVVFLINAVQSNKGLNMGSGKDSILSLKGGDTYEIKWSSNNIKRIGIVLYGPGEPTWIAKDIDAKKGSFSWKVYMYQKAGTGYRIALFEYPWKPDNLIVYGKETIEIIGPKYSSCNKLSIEKEWPYVPGDYENAKKVFVTDGTYTGNFGNLDGADKKCQQEAAKKGFPGNYYAFLGDDKVSAKERLKSDGPFIFADKAAELPEGATCHRFLAENKDTLIEKFTLKAEAAAIKIDEAVMKNFSSLWIGKLTPFAKRDCLFLVGKGDAGSFSFTTTCQNWTQGKEKIYTGSVPDYVSLERCYDDAGKSIPANYIGGYTSTQNQRGDIVIEGKSCNTGRHLLCIEE